VRLEDTKVAMFSKKCSFSWCGDVLLGLEPWFKRGARFNSS